jgi:hypothetical protein
VRVAIQQVASIRGGKNKLVLLRIAIGLLIRQRIIASRTHA